MARPLLASIFRRGRIDYQSVLRHLQKVRLEKTQDQFYQEAVEVVCRMVAAQGASLFFYHAPSDQWSLKVAAFHPPLLVALPSHSFFGEWLKGQEGIVSKSEILADPRYNEDRAQLFKYYMELKAHLVIPLKGPMDIIGFMALGPKVDGRDYDDREYEALHWVLSELTLIFSHASLNEELIRKQVLLQDLNRLKTEFVNNITHDLSTPLSSILGMSQSLMDGDVGLLTAEQKKCVEIISHSGEKLRHLFETILDISQLEATADQLHIQKINLHQMVSDLLPSFSKTAQSQETSIEMEIPENVPYVYGDVSKIQVVFQKLLDNAVCYTHQGRIVISAHRLGDRLQVELGDTGLGVDKRYHDSIFEPFWMVDGGLCRGGKGSGLGLSVAKKIVEIHGGRIWLESRPQKGAHFYFTLPLKPADLRLFSRQHVISPISSNG